MRSRILVLLLAMSACAPTKTRPPPSGDAPRNSVSEGYALLYELVSKQSGLDKALVMGGMGTDGKALIREIAEASKSAAAKIEAFAKADASLDLKHTALPEVEVRARSATESAATKHLLFAGKEFELRLLVTQADATEYGRMLAKELREVDQDRERRAWLKEFSAQYGKLRDRVEGRLTVRKD